MCHQAASYGQHLLLPAGELPAGTFPEFRQDRKNPVDLLHVSRQFIRRYLSAGNGAQEQVVFDAEAGKDVPAFRNAGDPQRGDLLRTPAGDLLAQEGNGTCTGRDQARYGADERRLPCAIGAQQGDDLSLVYPHRDIRERHDGTIHGGK